MILDYRKEIVSHLAQKNIEVQEKFGEFIYSGLILSKLFDNSPLEKKVKIAYGEGNITETDADYNLYFAIRNESESFYAENYDFLKKDNVLSQFFTDNMKIESSFYIGQDGEKEYAMVFLNYLNTRNVVATSTMFYKFFKEFVGQERIKTNKKFLTDLVQKVKNDEISKILKDNSDINWDKMKAERQYNQLVECAKRAFKNRISRAESELEAKRSQALDYMKLYNNLIAEINNINMILMNRDKMDVVDENTRTFLDFMSTNPMIKIKEFKENTFDFDIVTTMQYYKEDVYETVSDSTDKYVFEHVPRNERKKFKKILDDIFLNGKYEMRVAASYRFVLDGISSLEVNRNVSWDDIPRRYEGHMAHPHAIRYNCYNSFASNWNEALSNGNMLGAVNYAIALTQHINWEDPTVSSWMCERLYNDDEKYLIDKDGNAYSAKELMAKVGDE